MLLPYVDSGLHGDIAKRPEYSNQGTMNETFLQVRKLIQVLPDGLQGHLHRLHDKALELAALHGVDSKKVELAALGHDLFRAVDDQQLLTEARDARLAIHTIEEHVPILLH